MQDNKLRPVPFWSWNGELEPEKLVDQINWMHDNGIGGFFMHARGGLTTPYLGKKWFECVEACLKRAKELNMEAYAYDENGWPSGFAGGKLLEDIENHDMYLTAENGEFDPKADAHYPLDNNQYVNVYLHYAVSTADICNKDVVRKFIDLTHEKYKKHDIYGNLRGFFTDEPQYQRWGVPFTKALIPYFKERYFEDVFDRIGLLFEKRDNYKDYRYKYYKALQDLMLNNFSKQIYDWCDENGYKLTGHYCEEVTMGEQIMCCGGVMPFYEYEHIPGVDHLGRRIPTTSLTAKQLSSVMAQLDKKQGLCEMLAMIGWDATPNEIKKIVNYYAVHGITLVCQHLLPYSELGQRKRDYPQHFSNVNPWVGKGFKEFNDYIADVAKLMMESKEVVNIGVLHPIRSAYFEYDRRLDYQGQFGVGELDKSFSTLHKKLGDLGVQYHFLDEVIMEKHGRVEGNKLIVGHSQYEYVIIPEGTVTMDVYTEKLLQNFVTHGGKILLMGEAPTYLEGNPYQYDYLKSNVTFDEIINDRPFTASENESIRLSYRVDKNNKPFIYAVNIGDETDIILNGHKVHFDRAESKVIKLDKLEETEENKDTLTFRGQFKVEGQVDNYMTLDYLRYSKDGKNWSNKMYCLGAFNLLLQEKYQGPLFVKYDFDVKDVPSKCDALIEDTNIECVTINGNQVKKHGYEFEEGLDKYDIAKYLKEGNNEVIVKLNFFEKEDVYYALFGEGVSETLKNILVYDTTLEAIYLKGNFGVFGDFKPGSREDILIANKFYISKQKDVVNSLIEDGYPFFRGNIRLSQTINVDNPNKLLVFDKRFHLIDLYVNDQFVKRLLFDYKVDLSKYLHKGENKITIDLVVSNRNLLGPFHWVEEEPLAVGPFTFERPGTWKSDGTSEWFVSRYSFIKTII